MTQTLSEAAERLASLSAQQLGWLPDTFWRATPSELATSLADPNRPGSSATVSRAEIQNLMERESNG